MLLYSKTWLLISLVPFANRNCSGPRLKKEKGDTLFLLGFDIRREGMIPNMMVNLSLEGHIESCFERCCLLPLEFFLF